MTDDLTGDEFAEGDGGTVTFAVEGLSYELDLSSASVEAFREHMGEYVQHARRAGGTRRARVKASAPRSTAPKSTAPKSTGKAASSGGSDGPSPAEVRAWAQANGVEVSSRGRISGAVVQQYLTAQG